MVKSQSDQLSHGSEVQPASHEASLCWTGMGQQEGDSHIIDRFTGSNETRQFVLPHLGSSVVRKMSTKKKMKQF